MNKTPTWVIVIGAFMIVFGGCDTLGSLNDVAMPKFSEMKDMQKKMFKKLDEMEKETSDSTSSTSDSTREKMIDQNMDNLAEMMGGSWYDSKWFKIFSYIGIFVGLFYLIAGILLLLRKEYAIKTVIAALCVSIVFSLAKMFAMSSTESSLFAAVSNFGFIFSIAIDIGLLIAIFTIDKSNYLKRDVAEA